VAITPAATWLTQGGWDGGYSARAYWLHENPTATVRVLEFSWGDDGVRTFTGYGAATVSLEAGVDPAVYPTLEPVSSGALTISTEGAADDPLSLGLWANWPDGGATEIGGRPPARTEEVLPTPVLPGVTFTAVAETASNPLRAAWRAGLAATSTHTLSLPAPAVFTSPSSGATVGGSTEFTFSAVPRAIYVVAFEPTDPRSRLYVVTRSNTVRMPDLSWAGVLPPSGSVTAAVSAVGPFASMDAATAAPLAVLPRAQAPWVAHRLPPRDGFVTRHTLDVQVQ